MSRQGTFRKALFCAGLGVVAITAGAYFVFGRSSAQITGESPADRLASIHRIADEQPAGAGDVLVRAAGQDPDPSVRRAAIAVLAQFRSSGSRPVVEKGTQDAAPQVRSAAARTLALYSDVAATDRVGEMFRADPDPNVQAAAATALGRTNDPKALVWLVEGLETPSNNHEAQFRAMKELFIKLGVKYIGKGLTTETDWPVRARKVAEFAKQYPQVQEAFRAAGVSLVHRPENDFRTHPEHQREQKGTQP